MSFLVESTVESIHIRYLQFAPICPKKLHAVGFTDL